MFLRDTGNICNRTAIADAFGNEFTYGGLETLSSEYKNYVPERSLVMILCDYAIESVAFYYCQMVNHAVPMLMDKNLKPDLLLKIIRVYEPQFIWCTPGFANLLGDLVSDVIMRRGNHLLVKTRCKQYKIYARLALLLTTSGSTGSLKFVRLSYENLRCNIKAYTEKLDIREDDRGITTLPMHYCYGLSILHMHWMVGACVYVTDSSMLDISFWDLFESARITDFAGVPYTYDILKQIGFLDRKYESLRFMTQAGARLSDERQREFGTKLQARGVKLYLCYGQTEATTYISLLDHEKAVEKTGSVGAPIPGVAISVINANDRGEGELVCEGPSVSLGYAVGHSDLIRGNDHAGYWNTGDIVYVDREGDLFIKGRKSRFVKILGARVSLDDLEITLTENFPGEKFACAGEDNKIRIYYLKDSLEKEIMKFCSKELSIPRKMLECRFIKEIPYTDRGKIAYTKL